MSNPRVASIATKIERLVPKRYSEHARERVSEAYRIVTDKTLPHFVTEDPLFKTILGYVLCLTTPPRFTEAREAFGYAKSMKHEPDFGYLLAWYNAEKSSDQIESICINIADLVLQGKRYTEQEKISMIGRKANALFNRGKHRIFTDTTDAINDFKEASKLHLRAYKLYSDNGDQRTSNSYMYARNTIFFLLGKVSDPNRPWEIIDALTEIASSKDVYLDPIEGPISESFKNIRSVGHRSDVVARTRARLKLLSETLSNTARWTDDTAATRVRALISGAEAVFREHGKRN